MEEYLAINVKQSMAGLPKAYDKYVQNQYGKKPNWRYRYMSAFFGSLA